MKKTPLLQLIKKKVEQIDEHIGLNDHQSNALIALIRTEFGIRTFTLDIDVTSKLIKIRVIDANSHPLYIKPKNPNILEAMLAFLGIKGYKIRFSERLDE